MVLPKCNNIEARFSMHATGKLIKKKQHEISLSYLKMSIKSFMNNITQETFYDFLYYKM